MLDFCHKENHKTSIQTDIVHQPTTCHRVDTTRNLRLSSHSLTFLLGLAQFVIQNLPTSATRLERVIRWNQNYEQEPRIQKEYAKPFPTGKYFESWNLRLRFTMCFNIVSILKRYICGWICYDSWYQSQSSNPACNSLDKATSGRRRRRIPWQLMLFPFQGDETHHSSRRKKKKHDHDLLIYCWKCRTKLHSKLKTIHKKPTNSWQKNVISFTKSYFLALQMRRLLGKAQLSRPINLASQPLHPPYPRVLHVRPAVFNGGFSDLTNKSTLPETNSSPMKIPSFLVNTIKIRWDFPWLC